MRLLPWLLLRAFALVAALASTGSLEAAPHRLRVHPNPSITILSMTEGPDGFLWLAAVDSVYRFDGLHYQKIPGFPLTSARHIVCTADGSVWVGGLNGVVRYRSNFEIVLRESVISMATDGRRIFIKTPEQGVVFGLDGSTRTLPVGRREHMNFDPAGRLWFIRPVENRAVSVDPNRPDVPLANTPLPDAFGYIASDAQGRVWAADTSRAAHLENGRERKVLTRKYSQKIPRPFPLLPGRNGQLWFIGETVQGLSYPQEFRDRALNDQYLPTAGYEDSRGHLWIARLGLGLVEWIPDAAWQRWPDEDLADSAAAQVARTQDGIVAATHTKLFRLNNSGSWMPSGRRETNYAAVLPLHDGLLASIRRLGLARIGPSGEIVERPANPLPTNDEYRKLFKDHAGNVWVGNKRALLRLEGHPGSLVLRIEHLPDVEADTPAQAVDLEADALGRVWVGYASGLAWRDAQQRWHRLPTDRPVTAVRSFTFGHAGNEDELWVAYRSGGTFARLQRAGGVWKVTDFAAASGYEPEDTHFIKRDSRGWIWRGSPDGVRISDGVHVGPDDWLHISMRTGLATDSTDQYGFFEDTDGTVWIAGEDGISQLHPDPSWFMAPQNVRLPRVSRIELDGREDVLPADGMVLPRSSGTMQIEIGSLDTPPFRDIPLRYRLTPLFTDWRSCRNGTLRFDGLDTGKYTLEAALTGGGMAPVTSFRFEIAPPVTSTNWLGLAPLPIAGGALVLFGPWFSWSERFRYRLAKCLFLVRRRFTRSNSSGVSRDGIVAHDYSGETFLGRYQVLRIAARGGFSVVYDGRDLNTGTRIAVKMLSVTSADGGWLRDRFAHEVAALQSVRLPAVVRVVDTWITTDGDPCLAMPFLEGPTLREALRNGPFAPGRVAALIRELGNAVAELHARGIIHRDLKPENVMFSDATCRQPVIIDFGTAGLRGHHERLAMTTLLAGSFHYMAPERLTGHYGPATDIYSLGVIALEMLTGKRLDDLTVLSADDSFGEHLQQLIASVVDPDLCLALTRELSAVYRPRPQERPCDVKAWSQELAFLLDGA